MPKVRAEPLQAARALLLGLLSAVMIYPCAASDDTDLCGLTILVKDRRGEPVRGALVRLLDNTGAREIEARSGADGVVKICDFGFGPHEVVVGPGSCYPVRLRVARVLERSPIELYATLNECPSYPDERGFCIGYSRIKEPSGAAIQGATTEPQLTTAQQRSDQFGRLWLYLAPGWTRSFTVSAPGYAPRVEQVTCRNTEVIERSVELAPVQ